VSSVLLGVGTDETATQAFYQRLGFRDMGNALYLLPVSPASFGAGS
jgi:hypothetical protein